MTDESFPFMRWRMLALICCHVSPRLNGVFVRESMWDKQERGEKSKESAVLRGDLGCTFFKKISSYQMIHWRLQKALSCTHYDMTDGVFSSPKALNGCPPTVHLLPKYNATKTECRNMYDTLPRAAGFFRINYEKFENLFSVNALILCI